MAKNNTNYHIFKNNMDRHEHAQQWKAMVDTIDLRLTTKKSQICIPVVSSDDVTLEAPDALCSRIGDELAANPNPSGIRVRVATSTLHNLCKANCLLLNTIDENGIGKVENELQRKEAMNKHIKSGYILDFIMGKHVPSPILVLRENKHVINGTRHLIPVDGQQRLIAITKFIDGKFTISGTGTWMDGKTFNDLEPAMQNAILNMSYTVDVVDSVYIDDEMIVRLFHTLNSTSTPLTATEKLRVTKNTDFMKEVAAEVDGDTVVHGLLFPNVKKAVEVDRQNELSALLHVIALTRSDISNGTQSAYNNELLDKMTKKAENKKCLVTMRQVAKLMDSTFGKSFSCRFATKMNAFRKKELAYFDAAHFVQNDPYYCQYTGQWRIMRTESLVRKNFVSVMYSSWALYKAAGKPGKNVRLHGDAINLIQGVAERAMLTNEYKNKMAGGTNDLIRSQMLLVTIIDELLSSNVALMVDSTDHVMMVQNLKTIRASMASIPALNWKAV